MSDLNKNMAMGPLTRWDGNFGNGKLFVLNSEVKALQSLHTAKYLAHIF
jgi:hypothetical protein